MDAGTMRSIWTSAILQLPRRTVSSNPGGFEGCGECRLVVELARIDNKVPVCHIGRNRQATFPNVETDGLCTDENHRLPVRVQGLENVE